MCNRPDNLNLRLPAISIASTPVFMPHDTPPAHHSRCLVVTPLEFPRISASAQLWRCNQSIPRLDPLHPPLVDKRTVSLETPAVHQHNHQRALIMQRREHYRYHQGWRRPFYGTSSEKEEYRRELCTQLKKQMEEKYITLRLQVASESRETEYSREVDRLKESKEREEIIEHRKAMMAYRDENKRLMEQSWRDRALTRSQEALKERELLRLNPINWSETLK